MSGKPGPEPTRAPDWMRNDRGTLIATVERLYAKVNTTADERDRLLTELEWYRTLTVQRTEGVTSIDGGKTATKLHELWTERDRLRETVTELVETGSRVVASSVGDSDWISTMLAFRAAIERAKRGQKL